MIVSPAAKKTYFSFSHKSYSSIVAGVVEIDTTSFIGVVELNDSNWLFSFFLQSFSVANGAITPRPTKTPITSNPIRITVADCRSLSDEDINLVKDVCGILTPFQICNKKI